MENEHIHFSFEGKSLKPKHPINQGHLVPFIIEQHNLSVIHTANKMRKQNCKKSDINDYIRNNIQVY